jgi:lipopolysaccharide export system protein LptC
MADAPEPREMPTVESSVDRWSQRMSTSALEALRYTRFVTWMRRALPVAAAAILGVVIAYAVFPRNSDRVSLSYQKTANVEGDLAMTKPRLSGTDANGNPFVITADSAVQHGKNSHIVSLTGVDADLQYGGDRWANANAGMGVVDLDAGTLHLNGGISLFTDSGYELHTQSAFADLKKNILQGNERVSGHGPLGLVTADSFYIDRNTRHVTLQGHVHMKMYPGKVKR